jgi:hypothetical protein
MRTQRLAVFRPNTRDAASRWTLVRAPKHIAVKSVQWAAARKGR